MKLNFLLFFFGIIFFPIHSFSQKEINQTDDQDNPHGVWKKYYDGTEQLRYEGKFHHGKEVGEFRFYCEECKEQPIAIKKFHNKNNIADVKYFDPKGNLLSEGKMDGEDRIGEWITYHRNSKVAIVRETYSKGMLHGKKSTYYPDGKITEELEYSEGLRNGANIYYARNGVVIKNLIYKNDQLHGPASYFDGHGNLLIEGAYKDDKKHGVWKYYQNGDVILEETFPKKDKD